MKKIELELSAISHTGDKDYEYHINTILGVLRELVNAHNRLLNTHTVKVKEEHLCLNGVVGTTCNNPECQPTTPEKSMTLPDGKEVRTSYSEIFDQDGKSIEGITAIQAFNGAIIVATAKKMYCNNTEIFKTNISFEGVATSEKKCCDECKCNGMAIEDNLGVYHVACTNHNGSCHNLGCPCHKPVIYEEPCMCPPCMRMRIEEGKRNKNKETNLPTSSYEVTCGRCEKSFKHSCGPEK